MCKCYVVTAEIRFVQCTKNDDDESEAHLKAMQSLEKLTAVTVKNLEVKPFGK